MPDQEALDFLNAELSAGVDLPAEYTFNSRRPGGGQYKVIILGPPGVRTLEKIAKSRDDLGGTTINFAPTAPQGTCPCCHR